MMSFVLVSRNVKSVSYTHLDVYKRQFIDRACSLHDFGIFHGRAVKAFLTYMKDNIGCAPTFLTFFILLSLR